MSISQTERLVREQMGTPKPSQLTYQASLERSRRNPELTKMWDDLAKVERGILELQADTKKREYESNPGLLEAEVRAGMGLSKAKTEERGKPGQFPNFMHRTGYAVHRPEEEERKPTLEDDVRRQMGLRKLEKQ
jgi:hypothetical protein